MASFKLINRGRAKVDAENNILRSGPVQKLVLKGPWDERRWNDRWLEMQRGLVKYQWFEGGDKPIDTIYAGNISCIRSVIVEDQSIATNGGHANHPRKGSFKTPSVLDIVSGHTKDDTEELSSCFYLKSQADDSTYREYVFRVESPSQCKAWVEHIQKMIVAAAPPPITLAYRLRMLVHYIFHSRPFQVFVTLLIAVNFLAFVYAAQVPIHTRARARTHTHD